MNLALLARTLDIYFPLAVTLCMWYLPVLIYPDPLLDSQVCYSLFHCSLTPFTVFNYLLIFYIIIFTPPSPVCGYGACSYFLVKPTTGVLSWLYMTEMAHFSDERFLFHVSSCIFSHLYLPRNLFIYFIKAKCASVKMITFAENQKKTCLKMQRLLKTNKFSHLCCI